MGLKTINILECDRCGTTKTLDVDRPVLYELSSYAPDWLRVVNDRVLCPSCKEDYELIEAKHKVELNDFFTQK